MPALSRGIVSDMYNHCSVYVLFLSLHTHQGRDGPQGTIWSTGTPRTYRKTWKTRQTSRTMVFPLPVIAGICVVMAYSCGVCSVVVPCAWSQKCCSTSCACLGLICSTQIPCCAARLIFPGLLIH